MQYSFYFILFYFKTREMHQDKDPEHAVLWNECTAFTPTLGLNPDTDTEIWSTKQIHIPL